MEFDWTHSGCWSWIHSRLLTLLILWLAKVLLLILLSIVLLLEVLLTIVLLLVLLIITLMLIPIILHLRFQRILFALPRDIFLCICLVKSIVHFVIVYVIISVLLFPRFSLVLGFLMLAEIKLGTILFWFVHLTFETIVVILSCTIWRPRDHLWLLFRSIWLSFSPATCTLAWPHSFWLFISKYIYAGFSTRCVMDFDWCPLLISITKVILTFRCFDSAIHIISKLIVFVVTLRLPISRAWTWCIVIHLTHVKPIAILIWFLIAITIILLVVLLLLWLVVAPCNRPLASTTWLMMDLHTCLVMLRIIMLVHLLLLPVVRGSLFVSLCSLLGS